MRLRFADTSFYLAMLNRLDEHHAVANQLALATAVETVTTQWVLVELCDALCSTQEREYAKRLVRTIRSSPQVRVLTTHEIQFDEAFQLYASRADKGWSLTDCASFVAMQRFGITDALTADHHFEQAGFRALLKS